MTGASPGFADHFSEVAREYATFRPNYPDALFDALAALAPERRLAWDCATGNGQAALPLAARFERVVATDASEAQLAHAPRRAGIEYRVARAEASGLPDACADLVAVAQALHWFDIDAFHAEAARVLVPGGLLAEWSYGAPAVDGPPGPLLRAFHDETVGPCWAPERAHVEAGYRDLPFPFPRLPVPDLALTAEFTLPALLGYVGTWSAVRVFRTERGRDPLPDLARSLEAVWGAADATRCVRWPLMLRAGRKPAGTRAATD